MTSQCASLPASAMLHRVTKKPRKTAEEDTEASKKANKLMTPLRAIKKLHMQVHGSAMARLADVICQGTGTDVEQPPGPHSAAIGAADESAEARIASIFTMAQCRANSVQRGIVMVSDIQIACRILDFSKRHTEAISASFDMIYASLQNQNP